MTLTNAIPSRTIPTRELRDFHTDHRAYRWPHHTASAPHALLGAARYSPDGEVLTIQPGEILLAGNTALVARACLADLAPEEL